MRTISDLQYGPYPQNLLDIHLPDGACKDFVVWFHGGSLKFGTRKDIKIHEDLTAQGIGIASVEYRMYPDAKFPDFVEDAALSVRWLLENLKQYTSFERFFISGQSAGAWLTLMLALRSAAPPVTAQSMVVAPTPTTVTLPVAASTVTTVVSLLFQDAVSVSVRFVT